MDAYSSEAANSNALDRPPVLLAASSSAAMARAERTIDAHGLRIGARLPVEEAVARIKVQASATAVWVELDRDCGNDMDELLTQLSYDVSRGFYAGVIAVTPSLLDAVSARIEEPGVEIVVNADEAQRAAALTIAVASQGRPFGLSDVAADRNAERLRQLSEEVSRIAATLARLSSGPVLSRPAVEPMTPVSAPPLAAEIVRNVIRARRLRGRFFSQELFADPAWDMLLDLLQSEIEQIRVPVSNLCIAAAVPATTALRWLKTLVGQGLFVRRADPHDGRRVFVELAPEASHALRRYFAEVGPAAVI